MRSCDRSQPRCRILTGRSSHKLSAAAPPLKIAANKSTVYSAGGGEGRKFLTFDLLQEEQVNMYRRSLTPGSLLQRQIDQELRQTKIVVEKVRFKVNVAREDFPGVCADILIEYPKSAAQSAWGTFISDIRTRLGLEFIDRVIDRVDKTPVFRILTLRPDGEYFVRQREDSAILECINSGKAPVQISWSSTMNINESKLNLADADDYHTKMDARVMELITRPITRVEEYTTSKRILSAKTARDIIDAIDEVMQTQVREMEEDTDPTKPVNKNPDVDVISLHRLAFESLNRLANKAPEARVDVTENSLEFILDTIESFRSEVDVVTLGLQLINEFNLEKSIDTTDLFSLLMDCIQYFSPDSPNYRPRKMPKRLRPPEDVDEYANIVNVEKLGASSEPAIDLAEGQDKVPLEKGVDDMNAEREVVTAVPSIEHNEDTLQSMSAGGGGGISMTAGGNVVTTEELPDTVLKTEPFAISAPTIAAAEKAAEPSNTLPPLPNECEGILPPNTRSTTVPGSKGMSRREARRKAEEEQKLREKERIEAEETAAATATGGVLVNAVPSAQMETQQKLPQPNDLSVSNAPTSNENGGDEPRAITAPGRRTHRPSTRALRAATPTENMKKGKPSTPAKAKAWKGTKGSTDEFLSKGTAVTEAAEARNKKKIEANDERRKRRDAQKQIKLKALPDVAATRFEGFAGAMRKNTGLLQSFATLFKLVSYSYEYRKLAFDMGLDEELSEIALLCAAQPRVLEYALWIIHSLFSDCFAVGDLLSVAVAEQMLDAHTEVKRVSWTFLDSAISFVGRGKMDLEQLLNPMSAPHAKDSVADADDGLSEHKVNADEASPSVASFLPPIKGNLVDIRTSFASQAPKSASTAAGGTSIITEDPRSTSTRKSNITLPPISAADDVPGDISNSIASLPRKKERMKEPSSPPREKVKHSGQVVYSLERSSGKFILIKKKILDALGLKCFAERYLSLPNEQVVLAMSMISAVVDVDTKERHLATKWLEMWDDNTMQYRVLRKKGRDLSGV